MYTPAAVEDMRGVRDRRGGSCGVVSLGYLGVLMLASLGAADGVRSRGAMLVSYLLAVCFVGLSRFYFEDQGESSARMFRRPGAKGGPMLPGKATQVAKVLIAGAGSAGVMVAKELAAHPENGQGCCGGTWTTIRQRQAGWFWASRCSVWGKISEDSSRSGRLMR